MKPTAIALDTVYRTYHDFAVQRQDVDGPLRRSPVQGSFEFPADTINVYVSNKDAKPANAAAMTPYQNNPLPAGIYALPYPCKWVLFAAASGTPVVNTYGLIQAEDS